MKRFLIGGVSAVALAGSAFAISVLSPIQLASASRGAPAIEVQAGQSPDTTQPGNPQRRPKRDGDRGPGEMQKALDELVQDGTITQDQANKIKDKFQSLRGPGRGPKAPFMLGKGLEEVAASIGISVDQLKTELQSGKSIAEVAQANGADPQKVINDLVASASRRIDEAVTAGKVPADRADQMKARLTDMFTRFVNAKHDPNAEGPGFKRPDRQKPGDKAGPTTTAPPASGGTTDDTTGDTAKPGG
ncbi:MAG: hypothetical protein HYX32_13405 [Actinobacteria bacterium]|nr:hypothetical protein [Actinomycetota bacterium]